MAIRILKIQAVAELTGLSPTEIYRLRRRGDFPAPVGQGSRRAWIESEVEAWLLAQETARRLREEADWG